VAIDIANLRAATIETHQSYTERDTILYALGIGIGTGDAAVDPEALRYVYEEGLHTVPTMATMLAYPSGWWANPVYGINRAGVVNAGQSLALHRKLPCAGSVTSRLRVDAIEDKGPGRGVLIHTVRVLTDSATGDKLATTRQVIFCRGEGGMGSDDKPHAVATRPLPGRKPDQIATLSTRQEAALLFRLSGDLNPLHVDPVVAKTAGFAKPILHGLATFGMAAYALIAAGFRAYDFIEARFTAPMLPGERVRCVIWEEPDGRAFGVTSLESGKLILDRGWAAS
jgi:acyl dehydratase